ncbi:MAG: DUF1732 domain-containing protein [Deltaproteobacteria bacterium]|nr:DUF1732 domain-containing protein [Deltaproteobacteria bacterium]
MTGFGQAILQDRRGKGSVQIRSVNHRHADVHLRVPKLYMSLEDELREQARAQIHRGRTDIYVDRTPLKGRGYRVEVDEALMEQYCDALRRIKQRFRLEGDIDLQLVPRLPDLFQFKEPEEIEAGERQLALRALQAALKALTRSRDREGRNLKRDMTAEARRLTHTSRRLGKSAESIDRRLQEQNAAANPVGEAGSNAFKGSINEEVVRLGSHVEMLASLMREREPVGKKIDFLLQEIQRELNTIGAKAPQLEVVRLVLGGKESVEKIREQVQNVE